MRGKFAAINGSTQIRAGVIRPEIIIPSEKESGDRVDYEENNPDDMIGSNPKPVYI